MSDFIRRSLRLVVPSTLALALAAGASAQTVVSELPVRPADPGDLVEGTWYDWFTTGEATASIVSLIGVGGDLENLQPQPVSAGLLTTEQCLSCDRANVGLYLGSTIADVLPSLEIGYDYFKGPNPDGQSAEATAALKLEVYNPVCDDPASGGDCYTTLVYEIYQQGGGNPAEGVWTRAETSPTSGVFWTTGGFGLPGGGGGCPCNTLDWYLDNSSSDFADALLVSVQVGVGSYNAGMRAYFDNVTVSHDGGDGMDATYDFELVRSVDIDVRPNNTQNQVNTNANQLVPIAILGAEDFDPVSEVDIDTVVVRSASPRSTKFDTDDVNGDGYADLTLYFRGRSLDKPSEAECADDDAKLELNGATLLGELFVGVDFVEWTGPDCNF